MHGTHGRYDRRGKYDTHGDLVTNMTCVTNVDGMFAMLRPVLAICRPARALQMSLSSSEDPRHAPASLLLLTMEPLFLQFLWTLPVSCGQSPHRPLQIC